MTMIDLIKNVGVIASAVLGAITLTTTIVKPVRKKFISSIKKATNIDDINNDIKTIKEDMREKEDKIVEAITLLRQENEKQTAVLNELQGNVMIANQANKAALGNSIKHIYYKYLDCKELPAHEIEALYLLHGAYKSEGGNSFVDGIFNEMINDWNHI